ncbi:MAG: hypothetical protein AB2748_20885, partial [Candidatus Thiodiazotropha endolucinida]
DDTPDDLTDNETYHPNLPGMKSSDLLHTSSTALKISIQAGWMASIILVSLLVPQHRKSWLKM